MSIKNFKNKDLEELFYKGKSSKIGNRYHKNALLIMDLIDAAALLDDLKGTKNFHSLSGNRSGEYSMHVNGNYVITFRWEEPDAYDLNFEDYH